MRKRIATTLLVGLGLAAACAQLAHAQRLTTEQDAVVYIYSAFISQADPGVMAPKVAVGPELAQRLALPAGSEGPVVYRALIEITGGRTVDVRKATPAEIAAYGMRPGLDSRHPLYALEAGGESYLLQYDLQRLRIAFVGQLGLPDPQQRVLAKSSEPRPAAPVRMTWTALFDFDSAALTADTRARLEAEIGPRLAGIELRRIRLSGYADPIGAAAYNQRLSEKRADALREYFVEQGIDAARIEVSGNGAAEPVRDCPVGMGRVAVIDCLAPNRRVVVELQGMPR